MKWTLDRLENESDKQHLERLKLMLRLKRGLPHLFGRKLYPWQRKFLQTRNKKAFITAANQIGKSVINITKCIDWATDKSMWKILWPHYESAGQFWYFYPDYKLATTEFHEKWIRELLPNKEHLTESEWEKFGWEAEYDKKEIRAVRFNSGVTVYFKVYSQKSSALQAGSVFAIFADEELPLHHYDELKIRLSATDGYFHMVFTATLGQEFWRQVMEETGENEKFPEAFKQQISLFDCMYYEDGSPSAWTIERINARIADCSNEKEVQKRIYGKFVKAEGLKYPSFIYAENMKASDKFSKRDLEDREKWYVFAGLDYGSGGKDGHPSAICFIRTNFEYTKGEVFLTWRGDEIQTTAGDLLKKYYELIDEHKLRGRVVAAWYDYHCRDLKTISDRLGENFQAANKKHEDGEVVLNTLFKYKALDILKVYDAEKLAYELGSVTKDTDKRRAKDDLADATRYVATSIPWNMDEIKVEEKSKEVKRPTDIDFRKGKGDHKKDNDEFEAEIAYWNELAEE